MVLGVRLVCTVRVLRLGLESIVGWILLVLGIRVSLFFLGTRCVRVQFQVPLKAAKALASLVGYCTILLEARQQVM